MKFKLLPLLLLIFCVIAVSNGQEVSNQPILRIENGSHIGKLTKISTDAAGRFLVTAAEDKTARVWELSSGKLLSILRPPIGDDKDGMLYTVAISPDGDTIAAAGWTGNRSKFFIYIFDRESGRIVNKIPDFRDVIHKLTFSPDGKYLGATLAGRFGLRLFETKNYQLVGADLNYTASSFWLDFSPTSDRLITSSFDGFLRLYEIKDGKLNLLNKQTVKDREQPWGVKFSPDGSKIAVGFLKFVGASVISSADLSFLYDVDTSKFVKSNTYPTKIQVVAWSADGQKLFGGGTNYDNTRSYYLISEWTDEGQKYRGTAVSEGAIFDIEALKTGGVVFGVASPAGWGILDADRKRTRFVTTATPDFRNSNIGILVNEDASQVWFPYRIRDRNPAVFSLSDRKIEPRQGRETSFKSRIVESDELRIAGWNKGQEPSLNGSKLKLKPYETSFSMSILPSGREFLIGTGWHLRLFNEKGAALWRVSVPGVVWSLNNTANGKIAVAALDDGTIRWYRTTDGQELLALFTPNDNTGRWIVWTPSGYYDASPDAEDLIGWHVNNGRDASADFFPNHLFRAYFHRPDIIDRILQTMDETQAVKLANEKSGRRDEPQTIARILPPVIEIDSLKIEEMTNSTVKVSYKIRNHSGEPVTNISALVDGKEVRFESPRIVNGAAELNIQVARKDSEVTLIAENRFTKSLPANVKFKAKN